MYETKILSAFPILNKSRTPLVGSVFAIALFALAACDNNASRENRSAPAAQMSSSDGARGAAFAAEGWVARSLPEIASAIAAGELRSEDITRAYLDRIAEIDSAGPTLNSILTINPEALNEARLADERRDAGEALGPLHGVPIVVKDNIESKDAMPTTAGSMALKDNITGRDAPLVAGLRNDGAVILGKTNLSQWANFRSNPSISGWSSLGGQVRNPHMLDRNPCGSSSGSGAAVAASLAAGAIGTETNGSIICPANANGVVGFKPTVGIVSQQHIIPVSPSQDTAGPMTKSVKGAAMLMNAMATGNEATGNEATDYVAALDSESLKGARIGVLRFAVGSNSRIEGHFDVALSAMEAAGAELVEIEEYPNFPSDFGLYAQTVLEFEFKVSINAYLADLNPAVETRSLAELIEFNKKHANKELALFDQLVFIASEKTDGLDNPRYITAKESVQNATRRDGIDALLKEYDVNVLVSPSSVLAPPIDPINGDVWPEWSGAGYLAAIAGYPHASVPMGFVHGLPISVSFFGTANDDAKVLSFAYAYEQATDQRRAPQYLNDAFDVSDVKKALFKKSE